MEGGYEVMYTEAAARQLPASHFAKELMAVDERCACQLEWYYRSAAL